MSLLRTKIKDFGIVTTGKTPSTDKPEYYGGAYPFITPSDYDHKSFYCRTTERTVTDLAKSRHNNQFVFPDSVLVTCIGATIGKTCLSPSVALINQQINSITANQNYDSKYLYYLMIHNYEAIRAIGLGGGAATPLLNKSTFENIELSVHKLPEQKRIGNILSAYDELIEKNKQQIVLLEESAKLIYKEWFVYLRFTGHEKVKIVNGVPDGWRVGVISDFYNTGSGGTPSRKNDEYYGGDINWIKTQELLDGFIFEAEEKITDLGLRNSSAKLYPSGTVLVAMYGATIGQTGILDCESSTNQACCALITKDEYKLSPYLTVLFLLTNKTNLLKLAQGAAQTNVSQEIIRDMKFVLPDHKVLKEFDEKVNSIYDLIKNISKQNINLSKARDLLLPRLMNGDIEL